MVHFDNWGNPNSEMDAEDLWYDGPIYIVALSGTGSLHKGIKQHGTVYDDSQKFKMRPDL